MSTVFGGKKLKSFVLAFAMLCIAVAGTSPAAWAETVEVEANLTCPSGELIVKTITCSAGETVEAVGTCADGSTTTATAVCPVQAPSQSIELGETFRMGFRLHLGGLAGIPRSENSGESAGAHVLGALVLEFPNLFTDWWGLEFVGGAGVSLFPQKDDVLSTNTFESNFVFHLGNSVDIDAGYRFVSLADLDENLGQAHYARLGVSVKVGDQIQFGLAGLLGQAVFTQRERFSQSNEAGTVTKVNTFAVTRLSGGGEFTATFWFW